MAMNEFDKSMLVSELLGSYGTVPESDLDALTLKQIHADVRIGGISLPQASANSLLWLYCM